MSHITKALRLRPSFPEAHFNLAESLMSGPHPNPTRAIDHYPEAPKLRPGWIPCLERLSLALSTRPDAENRDAAEAIRIASQARR